MELKLLQDVVSQGGLFIVLVNVIRDVAHSFFDSVGTSIHSQPEGAVEIRDV